MSDNCARMREGWSAMTELMGLSMGPMDLQRQLETIFDQLIGLSWLGIERRGAILLMNAHDELVQVAQVGFGEDRAAHCERVALDRCGCGLAARSRSLVCRPCEGDREIHGARIAGDGSHFILPLIDGERAIGVLPIFLKAGHMPTETETMLMQDLARVLSGIVSRRLMEEVAQVHELELAEKQADVIRKLGAASEYRDSETGMHVMRMSHYAGVIAKVLGRPAEERERMIMAAPMHDVGKIGIADAILLKPGKLSGEEFAAMQAHPRIGADLLDGEDLLMRTARDIALSHHERWDGGGYPEGLKGDGIPMTGRICAVADVFDALTSKRPYKEPWPVDKAVDYVRQEAGKAFDPAVVDGFLQAMPEILRIRELYRDNIIDPQGVLKLPPLQPRHDAWVAWDDSVRVGIDVIDEHHRYLFDLTNDLHGAINERRGAREVGRVLRALEQYTIVHFREEERMMEHFGFSDMSRHMRLHYAFNDRIRDFWSEFKRSPLTMGFEMVYYLRDWLVVHIRKEDTKLNELVG
ncbi:MAG: bacteriohemerythrin [Magnetospirillum sp. WYHS-4]